MDGDGRSWTFPVYIISNELVDGFPGDEDDLPPNGGNPHPFNGEVFPGEPAWVQQWVDDQMINVPFHHAPAADQAAPAEPFIIEPMEEEAQWNQWPEHHVNTQPAPQAQDELSIEVSGLSIGLQSGSTNISWNNSSLMAFGQSVEQPMQEIVPRALSPPVQPRPPIKFFYSRRTRAPASGRKEAGKPSPMKAIGSSSRNDKGKSIMPDQPTLQDFLNATKEDDGNYHTAKGRGIVIREEED
ncbi:hypothetical protein GUJ93_ZPchr0001g31645 [Zizania palustris]|uniref:Uncharacterized protein n=1 Tax=Zizania palustris TaxID=103762 RepID=A0A8J5VDJ3_ZIZPA|nr:hypothetical protein GUJ93_ZPchr0001g31645 [Zizania palustris]